MLLPDSIIETPDNVSVTMRYDEENEYVFVMNFNNDIRKVNLPFDYEVISGVYENGNLNPYGVAVLRKIPL